MNDIEIMNYFLKQRTNKKNSYSFGDISINASGEMQISVMGMNNNVFNPTFFKNIHHIIERDYLIKTNGYSESLTLVIQGEEIGNDK